MAVLLYVFAFIIGIIIQYCVAKQFESVAADKGYEDSKYFHFCFWLGMVGYLLVIALPDRGSSKKTQYEVPNNAGYNPAPGYNPASYYPPVSEPQETTPFYYQPVEATNAYMVSETNIKCANCQRVQFRGNKSCNQCGAKFISIQ